VHKFMGFEASFGRSAHETRENANRSGQTAKLRVSNLNFDVMGYFPINDAETFFLMGIAGVEWIDPHMDANFNAIGFTTYHGSSKETRARIGLGAQWEFHRSWAVRFLAKFQDANFDGLAKHINTFQSGFVFRFC
jgi:Outer membrane protein beta-barrel domain